jgi:hypothetical protein
VSRGPGVPASAAIAALVLVLGACTGDLDPAWQLDHDRIIAVRATPPGILPGQTSTIDALLGKKGDKTSVAAPQAAMVVSPTSLSDVLAQSGGNWIVTAPSAERLAAVRTELGLAADAPVPLEVGVAYANQTLLAVKTVRLGESTANPSLASMNVMVNDTPPGSSELVVGKLVKVPLSVDADDVTYDVAWLTSCGTMHDFDLPTAYLKVEVDDPDAGELAVTVRDASGGVAWNVWPIHAE